MSDLILGSILNVLDNASLAGMKDESNVNLCDYVIQNIACKLRKVPPKCPMGIPNPGGRILF